MPFFSASFPASIRSFDLAFSFFDERLSLLPIDPIFLSTFLVDPLSFFCFLFFHFFFLVLPLLVVLAITLLCIYSFR